MGKSGIPSSGELYYQLCPRYVASLADMDDGGRRGEGGPRWNTARYRYYRSTRHNDRKCNSQEDKAHYPDTANNTPQSTSGNDHPYTAPRNHSILLVFSNTLSPTPAHSTIPQQAAHNRDLLNNASPSTSAVNVCSVTAGEPSPFSVWKGLLCWDPGRSGLTRKGDSAAAVLVCVAMTFGRTVEVMQMGARSQNGLYGWPEICV